MLLKYIYYRELSGKHQQLIRRCDREQKQYKRLSMNMEEIMYRMTQSEHGTDYSGFVSPLPAMDVPVFHRQLSRSPPTTPDAFRKKRSPLSNGGVVSPIPHSPRLIEGASSHRGDAFFPVESHTSRDTKSATPEENAKTSSNVTMRRKNMPLHIDIEALSLVTSETNRVDPDIQSPPTSPETAVEDSAGMKRSGTYDLLDQEFFGEDHNLSELVGETQE